MAKQLIYLDSYLLQKDMRIRLPKSLLGNLKVKKGETVFNIYLDKSDNSLVLKIREINSRNNE